MQVKGTSSVRIATWRGDKRISVDDTARLVVDDGEHLSANSGSTVAAGSTVYLGVNGQNATENNVIWRAPYDCFLLKLQAFATVAPGAGEAFSYTARVGSADASLSVSISGAAFDAPDAWAGQLIPVNRGDALAVKLVTTGGAASANHSIILQIAPR